KIKKKYFKKYKDNKKKIINLIIKVDIDGSLDVILDEIQKLSYNNNEIFINILKKSVGNITETDFILANTFNAIIIGFNVKDIINKKINNNIKKNIIFIFNLIYDILKFLKEKINKEINNKKLKFLGFANIIKIFNLKNKEIFGCKVIEGKIKKNNKILIIRNNKDIIYDGDILSLKIYNKNVLEVKKGESFGIIIKNFNKLKINDIIKSY
ncbi:MAG: translation initiation factor IF-2, partial [Candidatus Shikimatogenerans sp. JK-2022]|nr:translation initiation factor IF-2 [Candidatus Shikimatogenerans bostrichidophilus]